jgi:hypothetical protein
MLALDFVTQAQEMKAIIQGRPPGRLIIEYGPGRCGRQRFLFRAFRAQAFPLVQLA